MNCGSEIVAFGEVDGKDAPVKEPLGVMLQTLAAEAFKQALYALRLSWNADLNLFTRLFCTRTSVGVSLREVWLSLSSGVA